MLMPQRSEQWVGRPPAHALDLPYGASGPAFPEVRERGSAPAVSPGLHDAGDRLMALVDHVVEQTEGVRVRVREVEESLDLLSAELAGLERGDQEMVVRAPVRAAPLEGSQAARLTAIEMAVSGCSRGEVAQRLRQEFQTADATPILDDVFGAGSHDSSRMPWASGR